MCTWKAAVTTSNKSFGQLKNSQACSVALRHTSAQCYARYADTGNNCKLLALGLCEAHKDFTWLWKLHQMLGRCLVERRLCACSCLPGESNLRRSRRCSSVRPVVHLLLTPQRSICQQCCRAARVACDQFWAHAYASRAEACHGLCAGRYALHMQQH